MVVDVSLAQGIEPSFSLCKPQELTQDSKIRQWSIPTMDC